MLGFVVCQFILVYDSASEPESEALLSEILSNALGILTRNIKACNLWVMIRTAATQNNFDIELP